MKVKFKYGIKTYSGTVDEMVYGSYRHDNLCIGREYVYPTLTANNHLKGTITKNLADVWSKVDEDYNADFKAYCLRNGQENVAPDALIPSAFSMFLKMMFAWQESDPEHVDLTEVTIADIVALDADVRTVARAVTAEFLPSIEDASDLTHDIQGT